MAEEVKYEYKDNVICKIDIRPYQKDVSIETNKLSHLQGNPPGTVFLKASRILHGLQTRTGVFMRRPRFAQSTQPSPERILEVAKELQSLPISCNEELDEIARAIVIGLQSRPSFMNPFFKQCKDMKISTAEGFGHVKTLKQAMIDILFQGFEVIMSLRHRVEKIAEKYKGPVENKTKWIQVQVEKIVPNLKIKHKSMAILGFFMQGILTEDDLLQILDKLFSNLNETYLFCIFQLFLVVGVYLDFGIKYPSHKDTNLNPRISQYFSQLSRVAYNMTGFTDNCLSTNTVNMIRALIEYRKNHWCLSFEISKKLSPFK